MKRRKMTDFKTEYDALLNAIQRCTKESHPAYYNYGARGIAVCDEWQGGAKSGGFWRFLDHIGPRPSPNYSLDRINNDKGYEPGNVKWSTRGEQLNNRRPGCRDKKGRFSSPKL